jgi:hypothetical protein
MAAQSVVGVGHVIVKALAVAVVVVAAGLLAVAAATEDRGWSLWRCSNV